MSDFSNSRSAIEQLLTIMAQLRDPEQGCAWDRKQSWQTILPYTLEEVYEVADAIDRNDATALCEELGDLLLQIVFMAQIAREQGLFDFEQVAQGISDKLIRRHPHVFDNTVYASEAEQKQAWEAFKQAERHAKAEAGFFANIPTTLPALRYSQKIQKRAAQVGFDWSDWKQVVPKIQEELAEVASAIEQQEPFTRIEEEVGDVLLASSNLARLLGVDAENALRRSSNKFASRFEQVEALLMAQGLSLDQATLEQMDAAWEHAKTIEKAQKG